MKIGLVSKALLATLACSAAFSVQAATVWNEATNGDFSNDGLAPTSLLLGAGINTILGSTGDSGQGVDRDYFSFVVPVGATLTSLKLLDNTNVSGGSSFIGLQIGPQLTVTPTGGGSENLLSFLHFGNDSIGLDILPLLDGPFTGGLQSGIYSAWVQETGGGATYGFDFEVAAAPVPLPGAALLLVSGIAGLATLRRRKARAN